MGRYRIAALAVVAFGLAALTGAPNEAVAGPRGTSAASDIRPSDLSAQRRRLRRAPLRIEVYPDIGRSGSRFDIYPRPYRYEWPGPNAQRDCVTWLAPEYRPSGTVIVPQLRCRWIPG
jgi:hypothetical protein